MNDEIAHLLDRLLRTTRRGLKLNKGHTMKINTISKAIALAAAAAIISTTASFADTGTKSIHVNPKGVTTVTYGAMRNAPSNVRSTRFLGSSKSRLRVVKAGGTSKSTFLASIGSLLSKPFVKTNAPEEWTPISERGVHISGPHGLGS